MGKVPEVGVAAAEAASDATETSVQTSLMNVVIGFLSLG
jgi:hypothetical protein